jgi:NhaP-type Na+/H+ or K+/H+ antiporter
MSDSEIIIGLATIVVFGVGAQWIGRRTGVPSLLILLPAGLLAGDVLGLVEPEKLFGDLLFPGVTLLVSLLLFQSGLQLRLRDLPGTARSSVARLASVGLTITFLGASLTAAAVLDVPTELAFLVGAILVISGPTVVGPLLEVVRPREPTGTVLRWEGTILDPLGATLGVVVLNLILASDRGGVHPVLQMLGRLGLGITIGLTAAALLVFVMSRFLLTDDMEASVALLFAVAAFAFAEVLLSEAGLFATVAMGFATANQRMVPTGRIGGFGETLEVLIIGALFIVLGALVKLADLRDYVWQVVIVVAVLVLVVRPLTAAVSLVRTPLTGRDRALVGWMDPRGIVAAATAAQFASTLADNGYDSGFLVPVVFGVIVGTGLVYGLTAEPVARLLGVRRPPARGVALVGDDTWLVPFARCLVAAGVTTLLVTHEPQRADPIAGAGDQRGPAKVSLREGTERIEQAVRDAAVGEAVVSVPSDAALILLESSLIELLGRRHVLRVARGHATDAHAVIPERFSARPFAGEVSREEIARRIRAGAEVKVVVGAERERALLLAAVGSEGDVNLQPTAVAPDPDETLIGVVDAGP